VPVNVYDIFVPSDFIIVTEPEIFFPSTVPFQEHEEIPRSPPDIEVDVELVLEVPLVEFQLPLVEVPLELLRTLPVPEEVLPVPEEVLPEFPVEVLPTFPVPPEVPVPEEVFPEVPLVVFAPEEVLPVPVPLVLMEEPLDDVPLGSTLFF